jgi:hypothetical protein
LTELGHNPEAWTGLRYWRERRLKRPLLGLLSLTAASTGLGVIVVFHGEPLGEPLVIMSGWLIAVAWVGYAADYILVWSRSKRR